MPYNENVSTNDRTQFISRIRKIKCERNSNRREMEKINIFIYYDMDKVRSLWNEKYWFFILFLFSLSFSLSFCFSDRSVDMDRLKSISRLIFFSTLGFCYLNTTTSILKYIYWIIWCMQNGIFIQNSIQLIEMAYFRENLIFTKVEEWRRKTILAIDSFHW